MHKAACVTLGRHQPRHLPHLRYLLVASLITLWSWSWSWSWSSVILCPVLCLSGSECHHKYLRSLHEFKTLQPQHIPSGASVDATVVCTSANKQSMRDRDRDTGRPTCQPFLNHACQLSWPRLFKLDIVRLSTRRRSSPAALMSAWCLVVCAHTSVQMYHLSVCLHAHTRVRSSKQQVVDVGHQQLGQLGLSTTGCSFPLCPCIPWCRAVCRALCGRQGSTACRHLDQQAVLQTGNTFTRPCRHVHKQ